MAEEEVAASVDYSIEDWETIWKEHEKSNKTPRPVTEQLVKYVDELLPGGPGAIFLPLCGQTADLRWLYDKGHTVVGLDGVERAIKTIVARNNDLQFEEGKTHAGTAVYKSRDGRITLHVSDVLADHVRQLGPFDAVYDYGAYTAVCPGDRPKYVSTILATLKPSYRYLLEFCHDVSKDCEGPCVISFQTLKKELGSDKKLRFLETHDLSEEWSAESFFNTFVLITPKDK